ncbi:unnamed protein product, partial [Mesorhabditis belari]|uniref:Uncharacterized protein n=1 Tax=Mesorhabditis belari TaxID=2138241 RepID=A0AAF3JA33_9BILA
MPLYKSPVRHWLKIRLISTSRASTSAFKSINTRSNFCTLETVKRMKSHLLSVLFAVSLLLVVEGQWGPYYGPYGGMGPMGGFYGPPMWQRPYMRPYMARRPGFNGMGALQGAMMGAMMGMMGK